MFTSSSKVKEGAEKMMEEKLKESEGETSFLVRSFWYEVSDTK